jgi:putative nucleotidyltransferase with HDIG domain
MNDAENQLQELKNHIENLEVINEGLRESFEELSALYRLSETIASALTFGKVLTLLLEVIQEVVAYDAAAIFVYRGESDEFELQLEKNITPQLRQRMILQMKKNLLHWAVRQDRAFVVPDSGLGAWTQSVDQDGIKKSFIMIPVKARGQTIGLVNLVVFSDEGQFTQRDLSLLSILANQAGISAENARLYDSIRKDYNDVIQGLAKAVDARDHYTAEHSTRVSRYSFAIARRMELNSEMLEAVRWGGILHDVGKIGIPDAVLNKPGKLTSDEFAMMKNHCRLGAAIVQKIESLVHLVPLILYHHERFDGNGYPEGLKGKKIPLGARIINVADSFETITSDRVYRKARSNQEGLEEIRLCSGKQFDPEIVEIFSKDFEEILKEVLNGELK